MLCVFSAVQKTRRIFLYKDLFFERQPIQLHKFVGVAGIAIFAGEFAAAVRVDGPVERDAVGFAFVQNRFDRKHKIFRPFPGFALSESSWRNRSEAGNADQRRSGLKRGAWYSVSNCDNSIHLEILDSE